MFVVDGIENESCIVIDNVYICWVYWLCRYICKIMSDVVVFLFFRFYSYSLMLWFINDGKGIYFIIWFNRSNIESFIIEFK